MLSNFGYRSMSKSICFCNLGVFNLEFKKTVLSGGEVHEVSVGIMISPSNDCRLCEYAL